MNKSWVLYITLLIIALTVLILSGPEFLPGTY
uniref:Sec-independent protein translocase protein TatB protein n=1 Tax=Siphoviridae sp. ctX581 TaxID=2826365 RepID=A0A8S5MDS1_9CAUD|nr:MAG TPA: Sec-independent protein translocase protein TatB protein [Siphoviridae sp. ctX581]